jgi:hypothetical protein
MSVSRCLGWRVDSELIAQVRDLARERGVRANQILDESLRAYLESAQRPASSNELLARMLSAQGVSTEGIKRLH